MPSMNSVKRNIGKMIPLAILPVTLSIAASGCGSGDGTGSGVVVRDSIGIRIVENESPVWASSALSWTVDSVPSITIEGDPGTGEYFLHGVRAVQRTGAGLIAIANSGTEQVLLFDSTGTFVRAIGGPGEGPGEFSRVYGLHRCIGDTLIVYEGVRLSVLDSRGNFVRTELIAGRLANGRGNLEGVTDDCSRILLVESRDRQPRPGEGMYQLPSTLFWSALDGSSRDTVLNFPGADAYPSNVSGGLHFLRLPFGKVPVWTVSNDRVYYGAADQFEILAVDRRGQTKEIVRWNAERLPISEPDWERHEEGYRQLMQQEPSLRGNYPSPEDFPTPKVNPAYEGILVDDQGHLWIRQYQFGGWYDRFPTDQVWWVFDRTGRWLGEVQTPPGLRVLAVQNDHIAGVARDEDDVEHLELYRLIKPH